LSISFIHKIIRATYYMLFDLSWTWKCNSHYLFRGRRLSIFHSHFPCFCLGKCWKEGK